MKAEDLTRQMIAEMETTKFIKDGCLFTVRCRSLDGLKCMGERMWLEVDHTAKEV